MRVWKELGGRSPRRWRFNPRETYRPSAQLVAGEIRGVRWGRAFHALLWRNGRQRGPDRVPVVKRCRCDVVVSSGSDTCQQLVEPG